MKTLSAYLQFGNILWHFVLFVITANILTRSDDKREGKLFFHGFSSPFSTSMILKTLISERKQTAILDHVTLFACGRAMTVADDSFQLNKRKDVLFSLIFH